MGAERPKRKEKDQKMTGWVKKAKANITGKITKSKTK